MSKFWRANYKWLACGQDLIENEKNLFSFILLWFLLSIHTVLHRVFRLFHFFFHSCFVRSLCYYYHLITHTFFFLFQFLVGRNCIIAMMSLYQFLCRLLIIYYTLLGICSNWTHHDEVPAKYYLDQKLLMGNVMHWNWLVLYKWRIHTGEMDDCDIFLFSEKLWILWVFYLLWMTSNLDMVFATLVKYYALFSGYWSYGYFLDTVKRETEAFLLEGDKVLALQK